MRHNCYNWYRRHEEPPESLLPSIPIETLLPHLSKFRNEHQSIGNRAGQTTAAVTNDPISRTPTAIMDLTGLRWPRAWAMVTLLAASLTGGCQTAQQTQQPLGVLPPSAYTVSRDNQPPMTVPSTSMVTPAGWNSEEAARAEHNPAFIPLPPVAMPIPRELCKSVLPAYRIEPPDILSIEAVHLVPHSPYHLRTFDLLSIQCEGTLPDAPINGIFRLQPGGMVKLGFSYGEVAVGGLTVAEAEQAVEKHLRTHLKEPAVSLSLADIAAKQQISGQHLVGPDGSVNLGTYGSVRLVGLTLPEAKQALEEHLKEYLDNPEVAVDVYAYNSKMYYVITQGAGLGDGVFRFPITGNDTVLDAISQINGLQQVSSKKIWVARPTEDPRVMQILPVNWEEITAQGLAGTNYQLFPGDRIFIAEDKLIALDTALAKIVAPLERIMGFSLLGAGTATRLSGPVLHGGGNPNNNF